MLLLSAVGNLFGSLPQKPVTERSCSCSMCRSEWIWIKKELRRYGSLSNSISSLVIAWVCFSSNSFVKYIYSLNKLYQRKLLIHSPRWCMYLRIVLYFINIVLYGKLLKRTRPLQLSSVKRTSESSPLQTYTTLHA